MKTIKLILFILIMFPNIFCNKTITPGEWKGKGISFNVSENGVTITKLEAVIPHGDEYIVQWFENLKIDNKKFNSFQSGNSFLGIPERDLKGEFISNSLAKGTFNGVEWEAEPVK